MRTTKRFTPKVLDRFFRTGRGLGLLDDYIPWHRVGRGDPASHGRSHLQTWNGRQRELLSDHEWVEVLFAVMLPNLFDLREQFPLSMDSGKHELTQYRVDAPHGNYPGTSELAERLKIRHPKVTGDGDTDDWVPTTDLLLTLIYRSCTRDGPVNCHSVRRCVAWLFLLLVSFVRWDRTVSVHRARHSETEPAED